MRIKTKKIEFKPGHSQKELTAIIINGNIKEDAVYELQEIDEYTDQQRKLFEPLCRLYFNSLCFTREATTWEELRDDIKLSLGMGYEKIRYSDENHKLITVKYKEKDSIPDYVREDWKNGNKERVELILRSTTTYTKKQFMDMTDSLLREMIINGVLHSKYGKRFNQMLDKIGFVE